MRADAKLNRQAILDAAREQFSLHGSEVSMRTIASEAQVGIGTLYRHFPTKDDLTIGIFEDLSEKVHEILLTHQHPWETQEEAEEQWIDFFQRLAELKIGAFGPQLFTHLSTLSKFMEELQTRSQEFATAMEEVLNQAKHWGLLRQEVTPFQFHLGLSSITRPLPEMARTKAPDLENYLLDTYLRGLRP